MEDLIDLACKFYFEKAEVCMNGLPLVPFYSRFLCVQYPEKCPVSLWKEADSTKDAAASCEAAMEGSGVETVQ